MTTPTPVLASGRGCGEWALTSSSVFCFLATIPVLRASLFPPLRLPTWVKGQKTAGLQEPGPPAEEAS